MNITRFYIHNTKAPELIELFLIASVASVLGIRAFLAIADYPQLGGDSLHIAHMLWGGLFMALALLLFASLGHIAQRLSAILAGVGFGTFIDELGKFITSDNDYFFQPTIGLIYIIFISIFLLLRALRGRKSVGSEVALANALNRLELAAGGGLDSETKSEIIELLEMSDRRNPLARTLRTYVEDVEIRRGADMGFYFKIRDWLLEAYSRIALSRWFVRVLIIAAALFAMGQLIGTGLLLAVNLLPTQGLELGFTGWAQTASATVAAMITAIGIWRLRASRLSAYVWFQRSLLVSIFVTQVFAFFESELAAVGGLFLDILIYVALGFMIEREREGESYARTKD